MEHSYQSPSEQLRVTGSTRTTIITTLLLLLLVAATGVFTATDTVRNTSDRYLKETLQKATIAFAGARGINAMVSVAQKIEAGGSVKLLGTGGSAALSPFELLDPLNDLVERFSLVMLASCVSIGIQMVLNEALPWFSTWVLLPLAAAFILAAPALMHFRGNAGRWFFRAGVKTLVVTLLLAAMVPSMAALNHGVYNLFLDETYQTAANTLQEQETGMTASNAEKDGIMPDLGEFKRQALALKAKAQQLISHMLDLMVVFVIQAMLLPIAVLWVFIVLIRYGLGRKEMIPFETAFVK
ncbi:MAG: hypothetical protein SWH68_05745 [Thermodesulfobacteriota bacterium]|nr:hypothetical protein [Thermodesulfobacteriota bacterium]